MQHHSTSGRNARPSGSSSKRTRTKRWRLFAICSALLATGLIVAAFAHAAQRFSGSANPLADVTYDLTGNEPMYGDVIHQLSAGSYTYLQIQDGDKEPYWAVMLGTGPADGSRVRIDPIAKKTDFHSHRLHRVFSELIFGVISPQS